MARTTRSGTMLGPGIWRKGRPAIGMRARYLIFTNDVKRPASFAVARIESLKIIFEASTKIITRYQLYKKSPATLRRRSEPTLSLSKG